MTRDRPGPRIDRPGQRSRATVVVFFCLVDPWNLALFQLANALFGDAPLIRGVGLGALLQELTVQLYRTARVPTVLFGEGAGIQHNRLKAARGVRGAGRRWV